MDKVDRIMSSLIVIGAMLVAIPDVKSQTYQDETDLRANLSSGYNRFVRPSSPTTVSLYYNVRALKDLDITEQQMTMLGWMTAYWHDQRLVWDSSNQITEIGINWGWRPEFVVSNSADEFTLLGYTDANTRLRAYSFGTVKWNQMMFTKTSCDVDISNFPFDTQSCAIEVIFWTLSEDEVTLQGAYDYARTDAFLENAEWKLERSVIGVESVGFCCPVSQHQKIELMFTFIRRRPFYVMNLIFPTILLSMCTIWVFMLPTDSGERLGYALTILLAYTVQLSITTELIPTTSKQVPYIATYLLTVLVLCALVTCNVVLNVKLFYQEGPVYGWLKAVYRKVYPIVFLQLGCKKKTEKLNNKVEVVDVRQEIAKLNLQKKDLTDEEVTSNKIEEGEEKEEVTWAKFSMLLDRLCFFMYVIAVSVVNGTFLKSIL